MSFADEPAGADTEESWLAVIVRPKALKRADFVAIVVHDVVADVIGKVCFSFHITLDVKVYQCPWREASHQQKTLTFAFVPASGGNACFWGRSSRPEPVAARACSVMEKRRPFSS